MSDILIRNTLQEALRDDYWVIVDHPDDHTFSAERTVRSVPVEVTLSVKVVWGHSGIRVTTQLYGTVLDDRDFDKIPDAYNHLQNIDADAFLY